MDCKNNNIASATCGFTVRDIQRTGSPTRLAVLQALDALDLNDHVASTRDADERGEFIRLSLCEPEKSAWMPGNSTLGLCQKLHLDTLGKSCDLQREVLLTLLGCPQILEFPGVDELTSAVRMRRYIVDAARKTMLAFETAHAERPEDCWAYVSGKGFVLRPGVSLITALEKATQPDVSGTLYSFSCYRASEYVILLAIARELTDSNPTLLAQLQSYWESRAIMSGQFHDVFLREQGSMENPLPSDFYIPGDRVWFRNPDEASSEASGFEGSWVIYLGNGLFANFWKRDQPFSMTTKCLELYHWRNATYVDGEGELRVDEAKVEALVQATLHDSEEVARIVALMWRYRETKGIYRDGGCVDTTREFPRWVRPGTADLILPAQ